MEAFAWPIAALIAFLVALFYLGKPLKAFLGRAQKISKDGIEASIPQAQESKSTLETKSTTAYDILREFDNSVLTRAEEELKKNLMDRKLTDPAEREKLLTRALASTYLGLVFEKLYTLILGSQLSVLNASSTGPLERMTVETLYSKTKEEYPNFYSDFPFDHWIAFLLSRELLISRDTFYVITDNGREFLKYLVQEGYSLNKGL